MPLPDEQAPYAVYNPDSSFYARIDPCHGECDYSYASCVDVLIRELERATWGCPLVFDEYARWSGAMPGWIQDELAEPAVINPTFPDFVRFACQELGYEADVKDARVPAR